MHTAVPVIPDTSIAQNLIQTENHVIAYVNVKKMIPFQNFIAKLSIHPVQYVTNHLKFIVLHGIISAENMKLCVIAAYVLLHSGN